MIVGNTLARARGTRVERKLDTFEGFRTDLIVSDANGQPSPQAFLVEQKPGFTLRTHFHLQHQFQVVVAGAGTLGRHPLQPFAVHYASPESGYGPIVAGAEGLSYLTLRVVSEPGAWFLPEERARMRRGLSKVQRTAAASHASSAAEMSRCVAASVDEVLPPGADGLAAWLVRLPPRSATTLAGADRGAGRFHVVTAGGLRVDGSDEGGLAVLFTSADEAAMELRAGAAGADVLVLQFPHSALRDAADPAGASRAGAHVVRTA